MAKARTELEKTALKLSQSLPYIGYAVTEWAINTDIWGTTIDRETHLVKKGIALCPFCNKEFKTDASVGESAECPHCHKRLKVLEGRKYKYNKYMCVSTSRKVEGWMVKEYGQVHIENRKQGRICREYHPLFQWWTDKNGYRVCIGSMVNGFKAWCDDPWCWSEFEVRHPRPSNYYMTETNYDERGFYSCPIKESDHPLDKMVDKFSKEYGQSLVIDAMRYCNGDILETLSKIDLPKVLEYYFSGYASSISYYWKTLLIARRHGYDIEKDFTMYLDYLRSLNYLGKDLKSPHYICPTNLQESHNWAMHKAILKQREEDALRERRRIIRDQEREKKKMEENNSQVLAYETNLGTLKDIVIENDNITISTLKSVLEVLDEGTHMHHCVYAMGYWKRPENLLMSAKDKDGNRVETIQIDLNSFKIIQSRGVNNSCTEHHNEIIGLLNENMNRIKEIRKSSRN